MAALSADAESLRSRLRESEQAAAAAADEAAATIDELSAQLADSVHAAAEASGALADAQSRIAALEIDLEANRAVGEEVEVRGRGQSVGDNSVEVPRTYAGSVFGLARGSSLFPGGVCNLMVREIGCVDTT